MPSERHHIQKTTVLAALLIAFVFSAFFPHDSIAATSEAKAQPLTNPTVLFEKGLLTVQAEGEALNALLGEIAKKAGMAVSISESLKNEKVTVRLEKVTLKRGLSSVLRSAGVINYALGYQPGNEPGKIGQWVIGEIHLVEKGPSTETSKDAPVVTPATTTGQEGRPKNKGSFEKEPFFDKNLNRFVEVVEGEAMVRFKKGMTDDEIGKVLKELGATVIRKNPLGVYRLRIPKETSVSEFVEQQEKDKPIEFVEPNFIFSALLAPQIPPNDPLLSSQWAIAKIQVEKAWAVTTGSPKIIVAILDTGIDLTHPDLKHKILPGIDIVDADSDPSDEEGHGTFVAGIVAAETNNAIGIAGVSWGSRLMPVKVLSAFGGTSADISAGIVYAADHRARVLNLSLGGHSNSQTMSDAVEYAHAKGAVIVAAVGNDDSSNLTYPAAYEKVIGVSATNSEDRIWSPSNQGDHITLSAPGADIVSTGLDNTYNNESGTSLAAPHVSGVAALIFSKRPDLSNAQVEQILYQTADDLGKKGLDRTFGYGRVNAARALMAASAAQTKLVPDIDWDGIANVFDEDADGDGALNTIDPDDDGDGIVDHADSTPSGVGTLTDIDGDGILDAIDPDIDGDGTVNALDSDVDGDGALTTADADDDGDRVNDSLDATPSGIGTLADVDGDDIPNAADPDMDGDGIANALDDDADGSGVPSCQGIKATIFGNGGNNDIRGTSGPDVIHGLGGNDIIRGGDGNDIICGGAGKDKLYGQKGNDKLYGQAGQDKLNGGAGKDRCDGGSGRDTTQTCEKLKSIP